MRERAERGAMRQARLVNAARAPARRLGSEWDLLALTLRREPLAGLLLLVAAAPFWALRDLLGYISREVLVYDGLRRVAIRWRHPLAPLVALALAVALLLALIFVAPVVRGARLWRRIARRGG